MPYTCSQCGAQNPDGAQFCYNCGGPSPVPGAPSRPNLAKPESNPYQQPPQPQSNPYQTPSANPYAAPSYPPPASNPYGAPSQPSPYDQQGMAPQSNPYGAPPAYGQTYGSSIGVGYGSPEVLDLQGKAKNGMILGIVGLVCCQLCAPVAFFFGLSARSGLQRMGIQEGQGQALAAMIMGGIGTVFMVLWLILNIISAIARS